VQPRPARPAAARAPHSPPLRRCPAGPPVLAAPPTPRSPPRARGPPPAAGTPPNDAQSPSSAVPGRHMEARPSAVPPSSPRTTSAVRVHEPRSRDEPVVDEHPKPPVADGSPDAETQPDVVRADRPDDADPLNDRPIPVGNHSLLPPTIANPSTDSPSPGWDAPREPHPTRPRQRSPTTPKPPKTLCSPLPRQPPSAGSSSSRPARSVLFSLLRLLSSVLPTPSSRLSVRLLFTTAPPSTPSLHQLCLCRALTPPEHLIVFGRGQGPAQAANPHPNGDRVWTKDPQGRPHPSPGRRVAASPPQGFSGRLAIQFLARRRREASTACRGAPVQFQPRRVHPHVGVATRVQLDAWRETLTVGARRVGWKIALEIQEVKAPWRPIRCSARSRAPPARTGKHLRQRPRHPSALAPKPDTRSPLGSARPDGRRAHHRTGHRPRRPPNGLEEIVRQRLPPRRRNRARPVGARRSGTKARLLVGGQLREAPR